MAIAVTLVTGEPVTGLWCDTCQLPSNVMVPVLSLTMTGITTVAEFTMCSQHDTPAHLP